jgi:hypothetical protein
MEKSVLLRKVPIRRKRPGADTQHCAEAANLGGFLPAGLRRKAGSIKSSPLMVFRSYPTRRSSDAGNPLAEQCKAGSNLEAKHPE